MADSVILFNVPFSNPHAHQQLQNGWILKKIASQKLVSSGTSSVYGHPNVRALTTFGKWGLQPKHSNSKPVDSNFN
jgi:hypothetical protein